MACVHPNFLYIGVFENMVAIAFQNDFHSEMHQNNIYIFIFKKLFLISTHQNDLKILK
jgi:hypothetical protein